MDTLRLTLGDSVSPEQPEIQQAAAILRRGGLVAFPTETVYGLGANALDRDAVMRIFEAKQRPSWDPIIVHCASVEMIPELVREWPEVARRLAERFMPGPLTLLLPKLDVIPDACTAGRDKVGVRIPAHPVARALIVAAGVPIAAPSANRFGHTSPTTAEHVLRDLDGRIDAVLDAGAAHVGVESTVIDPTTTPPMIYRPGGVTREQIESVIGPVEVAQRPVVDAPPESLESPGLGIRHYAPRAKVVLVEGEGEMAAVVEDLMLDRRRVGMMRPLFWLTHSMLADGAVRYDWGDFNHPPELARKLYDGLRWLDEQGVEVIVCPLPPPVGLGLAIRDRLMKAAK